MRQLFIDLLYISSVQKLTSGRLIFVDKIDMAYWALLVALRCSKFDVVNDLLHMEVLLLLNLPVINSLLHCEIIK